MSTDDSVSEDVSSSAALSHCHGDSVGHKGSDASLVSSEGTSPEDRSTTARLGGPDDITAGDKMRSVCVHKGKNLPFIIPSSLETLRVLVQEIQSSGETDPEMWKDCEGRWLHLFQLVEKQYQDQILGQQQQYQSHIQLIQDEIKALVQLQNRHPEVSPSSVTKWSPHSPKEDLLTSTDRTVFTQNLPGEPTSATLSSGYGTMSAWETGHEAAGSPGKHGGTGPERREHQWSYQDRTVGPLVQDVISTVEDVQLGLRPHRRSVVNNTRQTLTSWSQRQRLRSTRVKVPDQSQDMQAEPVARLRCSSAASDSSGLTYWHLHEDDLYRPLPDSLDRNAHLRLQEATLTMEPGLSLREIYQNKQRAEGDCSVRSSLLSLQVLGPAASTRHSDRTSGFTSPSHFGSPSFTAPTRTGPVPSVTPDSMVESGLNQVDTDCNSEVSSESVAGPLQLQELDSSQDQNHPRLIRTTEKPRNSSTEKNAPACGLTPSVDPVVLSLLRQNLRDKHARHVNDLRAYYESEIRTLRDQLQRLPEDLDQRNQLLTDRCRRLEERVSEANQRVHLLEESNRHLKESLADWSQRHTIATATIESLQQRLDQSRQAEQEKDSVMNRLTTRVQHLEDALRLSNQEAGQKLVQRGQEHKMLKELLGDYDSLTKEHSGLKNQLVSTENKLGNANIRIMDLKKTVSKLETQMKQMDHQHQAQTRHSLKRTTQPSGAGLLHHPDLLLSPRRVQPEPDVTHRSSPCPSGTGSRAQSPTDADIWRCSSPPECEQVQTQRHEQNQWESSRRSQTPMMRALVQLEETRATESHAPWVSGRQKTPLDQRKKDFREGVGQRVKPGSVSGRESAAALLRARRSLSPEGQRSSSLPPSAQRNLWATPSKKETLLAPGSSRSSPKRSPSDNYSTAFGHMMPREEHLTRTDAHLNRRNSQHCSPRKRLQFTRSAQGTDHQESGAPHSPAEEHQDLASPEFYETSTLNLTQAQQLCEELTQEKLQIEAALNQVTGSGARVGSQRRSDQEVLEKRLDHVTRALVFTRRALKRLKGSAAV